MTDEPERLADWSTPDDYPGHDEAEWQDVTTVGSAYQVQIDISKLGEFRHRRRQPGSPWRRGSGPADLNTEPGDVRQPEDLKMATAERVLDALIELNAAVKLAKGLGLKVEVEVVPGGAQAIVVRAFQRLV